MNRQPVAAGRIMNCSSARWQKVPLICVSTIIPSTYCSWNAGTHSRDQSRDFFFRLSWRSPAGPERGRVTRGGEVWRGAGMKVKWGRGVQRRMRGRVDELFKGFGRKEKSRLHWKKWNALPTSCSHGPSCSTPILTLTDIYCLFPFSQLWNEEGEGCPFRFHVTQREIYSNVANEMISSVLMLCLSKVSFRSKWARGKSPLAQKTFVEVVTA